MSHRVLSFAQMGEQLESLNIYHEGSRPSHVPHLLGGTPRGYSRTRESVPHEAPLVTTQYTLNEDTLNDYRKKESDSPVDLVHHEGEYYILQGHHRSVAARMEGRPVYANVYRKDRR